MGWFDLCVCIYNLCVDLCLCVRMARDSWSTLINVTFIFMMALKYIRAVKVDNTEEFIHILCSKRANIHEMISDWFTLAHAQYRRQGIWRSHVFPMGHILNFTSGNFLQARDMAFAARVDSQ